MDTKATLDNNQKSGLAATIAYHLFLLLLFLMVGLPYLEPPPPKFGFEVALGNSDQGMGEEYSEQQVESTQETVQEEVVEETSEQVAQQEVITQDVQETVSVNSSEQQDVIEKKEEEEQPKPSERLMRHSNVWDESTDNQSSNRGETGQQGNQGSPDGDPNSDSFGGLGGDGSFQFSLAGRKMVAKPKIKDNSQEEGKVVVDIVVDQKGRVVRAEPGGRGSTTTSANLYKKAKEAALNTRFSVNPDAPYQQKGQIVFTFLVKG